MLVDSSAPIGPTQVVDEPDVSRPEVPRLCDSTGGGSTCVRLIEEPAECLDGSDSDDFLSNLGRSKRRSVRPGSWRGPRVLAELLACLAREGGKRSPPLDARVAFASGCMTF